MANNLLADVEKRLNTTNLVDEIENVTKKSGWKFWLLAPLALLAISGCAFLVVRRIRQG